MEDRQIVELYFARSESAIAETETKYGRYCRYIAERILHDSSDAEEVVNDAYLKVWDTIPPNRPDSLKSYIGMICGRLALNRYDQRRTRKRGEGQTALALEELSECVSDRAAADPADVIALRDALNRFLESLPARARKIFVRRYWYMSTVAEIAAEFSMRESSVTVLMLRTRKKLKQFLQKEGFTV